MLAHRALETSKFHNCYIRNITNLVNLTDLALNDFLLFPLMNFGVWVAAVDLSFSSAVKVQMCMYQLSEKEMISLTWSVYQRKFMSVTPVVVNVA